MSLEDKIRAWANSSAGQAKIKSAMSDAFSHGESFGGFSPAKAEALAQSLSDAIRDAVPPALSGSYAADVSAEWNGKAFELNVDIADKSLYRPSLMPSIYDGIDNIYALFSKGYVLSTNAIQPYGMWHGSMTFALRQRDPNPFISEAVDKWVSAHQKEFSKLTLNHINAMYT